MIWIKRVTSTPAPQGHIIDSFETGDDKTTNAPSMRATLEKLNAKAEIDDNTYISDKTLSSEKIKQMFDSVDGVALDDTAPSTTSVYSSSKVMSELDALTTALLDRFYPVGCVVITFQEMEDQDLIARYGGNAWSPIQGGRFLITPDSSHTVDTTGGSRTVTLTENNLPSHSHSYTNTIVGSTKLTTNQIPSHSHSTFASATPWGSDWHDTERQMTCRSSSERSWAPTTGTTGGGGSHTHGDISQSKTTGNTGSGTAVNIEPPYIAVYMWRRIA